MIPAPAIYVGRVTHVRFRPRRHRFDYRVFSLLLDIDRPAADCRLLAWNRPGPISFHESDHGLRDGSPLRPWVERLAAEAGVDVAGGAIRLLCYPRILGFVFNPLSVFYCWDRSHRLAAIVHEVRNTFGESHAYVLPVPDAAAPVIRQACAKAFHVSPFVPMACTYRFALAHPAETVRIAIREEDAGGLLLAASFAGDRRPLDDRSLAGAVLRHPLMTLKVIAGIHYEALRLLLKGAPVHRRVPAAVARAVPRSRSR